MFSVLFIVFELFNYTANAALICRTTTAFSLRKPQILYKEPTARETRVFANADGHDLARCYSAYGPVPIPKILTLLSVPFTSQINLPYIFTSGFAVSFATLTKVTS